MHREYHEVYAVHVYLRSIRISLVPTNACFLNVRANVVQNNQIKKLTHYRYALEGKLTKI